MNNMKIRHFLALYPSRNLLLCSYSLCQFSWLQIFLAILFFLLMLSMVFDKILHFTLCMSLVNTHVIVGDAGRVRESNPRREWGQKDDLHRKKVATTLASPRNSEVYIWLHNYELIKNRFLYSIYWIRTCSLYTEICIFNQLRRQSVLPL